MRKLATAVLFAGLFPAVGVIGADQPGAGGLLVRDLERILKQLDKRLEVLEKRLELLTKENEKLRAEIESLKGRAAERVSRKVRTARKKKVPAEKAVAAPKARLGLCLSEIKEARESRIIVEEVEPGFAGEACGLKPGDTVLSINGKEVRTLQDVEKALGDLRNGSRVEVVFRTKEGQTVKAVVRASGRRGEAKCLSHRVIGAPGRKKPHKAQAEKEKKTEAESKRGVRLGVVCTEGAGEGLLIVAVLRNSPADQAGVQPGEFILSAGGRKVARLDDLRKAVEAAGQGKLALRLRSAKGDEREITVVLGKAPGPERKKNAERKAKPQKPKAKEPSGEKPKKKKPAGKPYLGIEVIYQGESVQIERVVPGGPCDGKLKPGDVIVAVGTLEIENLSDLRRAVGTLKPGRPVRITVFREGKEVKIEVVPAGR